MSPSRRVRSALIDTDFIVALLDRNDPLHEACNEAVRRAPCGQWITTWAVMCESMYFAARQLGIAAQLELCDLINDGIYKVSDTSNIAMIRRYVEQYSDLPLDFADATLAAHAMESGIRRIYTHDEHFRAVRVPFDSDNALEVVA
jgi:predicted nucleic acid-binding protein